MEVHQVIIIHGLFLTACFFLFINSSSSTFQEHKHQFMIAEVEEVSGKYFDYIIVGGGASGCPLAATLSEKFSVLVIERGGSPYGDPIISESKNYGLALSQTDEFSSVAQSFVSEDGVMNHRGRVLGGSTAINSGFYSRASEDFIERLGWDKKLVRDAYEWVESKIVFRPNELNPWQSVMKESLVEEGGLPFNGFTLEHVAGTKVSGSIFDEYGNRHSSADLLGAGPAGNLKRLIVLLNATVQSVIFHDNNGNAMARGVRFIKSDGSTTSGETYEAFIDRPMDSGSMGEVILAAGALGSPQILMLSGIGPQEHLKHFNITPIMDAAEVGKDIKDNPSISLLIDSPETLKPDMPQVVGITDDYQIIIQSVNRYVSPNVTKLRIGSKNAFPLSKGKLELKSKDPRQNPSVRYNYLTEERDLDECVKMVHLVRKIALSNQIKSFLGYEQHEFERQSSEEELREFCKMNVITYYHYHGGCGIGSVVDVDYKVYGVKGLRVIDGSTLPDTPGTNPMATLMMLGRYQGIKILKERNHEDLLHCSHEYSDQYQTTSSFQCLDILCSNKGLVLAKTCSFTRTVI